MSRRAFGPMTIQIRERSDGVTVECRVIPRAGREEIRGERDGALLVALTAPPVEGRANEALIAIVAAAVGIPRSRVSLLTGAQSRKKVLFLQGVDAHSARARLEAAATPKP